VTTKTRDSFAVLGDFEADAMTRHILMTYEGFNLELRVRHSIDVVGGPLLDEE
jgi:hypothetical protein